MEKKENDELDWIAISERVIDFLKSTGLSQAEIGEAIDDNQSNVSKYLIGTRKISMSFINKLVASLTLKADKNYLLYGIKTDNSIDYESNDNPYKMKYMNKLEEIDELKSGMIVLLGDKSRLEGVINALRSQIEQLNKKSRKQSGGSAPEKIADAG